MAKLNATNAAKYAGVHYATILRAIRSGDLPSDYDGYQHMIRVADLARFANHDQRRFNPDARIRVRATYTSLYGLGAAERLYKAHYPTGTWTDFSERFGGTPERARSRFRRSQPNTHWFAAPVLSRV